MRQPIPFLTAAFATAALPLAAQAADFDYDPPIYVEEAPEYVPVEIGSGWYLRGDVAYNFNRPYRNRLIGPNPAITYEDSAVPVSASIGAGYHFNDYLRADLQFGYLGGNQATMRYAAAGPSQVEMNADNTLWSGMISAYGDLGTIAGFTPYLGAGVGLVVSDREYRFEQDFQDPAVADQRFDDSKKGYSFAYAVGAGVAYRVSKNVSVDVGYRYLSAPGAERVELTGPGTYNIKKGIDLHQIRVGLRYDLW